MYPAISFLLSLLLLAALTGCDYFRLLRPSVLKQLNPDVVRLVNTLPAMDDPNQLILARLIGHGGLVRARESAPGVFHATVHVPPGQFIWRPAAVVMPRGGELELEFHNADPYSPHAAILPSDDDRQLLLLPSETAGRVRLRLDEPGLYSFDCPIGNHAGRGMVGLILVSGDVAPEARLARPEQPRP